MALERFSLATAPLDSDADVVPNGGDDGNRPPRLPRWTRQEILVLIQGKRMAEDRVRRGRTAGLAFGSGQVEPKWASISSYCKRHGVNRGPVQCRKRWSNLAGDYKKIKEWESHTREEPDSFWVMRNDLRRERKLPGFFDREVYDMLDGRGPSPALALALAPSTAAEEEEVEAEPEVVFDSGRRAATTDDALFSDFEQSGQDEIVGCWEKEKEARKTAIPAPIPISGTEHEKQPTPSPKTHEGRKRKRFEPDADEDMTLQNQLSEVIERNGRLLSSQLEAQNTNFQLDMEQRKDHVNSLIAVLDKLADAMGRIANKL